MNPTGAFGLRRHLAEDHLLELRGLAYEQLVAIHEEDHGIEQGHDHALAGGEEPDR